jgi:hypothetical protein
MTLIAVAATINVLVAGSAGIRASVAVPRHTGSVPHAKTISEATKYFAFDLWGIEKTTVEELEDLDEGHSYILLASSQVETVEDEADFASLSGCSGGTDCGGCGCSTSCARCWVISAEAVFLDRSEADAVPLIADQLSGAEVLDAEDLDLGIAAGTRIRIIRPQPLISWLACHCWCWEMGYLGIDSWDVSETPMVPSSPVAIGPGFVLPASGPGVLYEVSYASDLHSWEINLRRDLVPCVAVLAGFRWVELTEDFRMDEVGLTSQNIYSVNTNNHLYGLQIGSDIWLWSWTSRLHLDALIRAGIYYNRADQSTVAPVLSPLVGLFVDRISARDDQTAFLGEIGLVGVWDLSQCLGLRAGYQLMWIDGVALAPEQIPVTDLTAPGSVVLDASGSVFYHGATVGLELRW